MIAQTLSVVVPSLGCNKNCPYCVSKMTPLTHYNPALHDRNIEKVSLFAARSGVEAVLFTCQGEPTLNMEFVCKTANKFRNFPLEIQTNGLRLLENPYHITNLLLDNGFDVVAVSLDSEKQFEDYRVMLCGLANQITVRLTISVSLVLGKYLNYSELFKYAKEVGAHQICVRKLTFPEDCRNDEPKKWIESMAMGDTIDEALDDLRTVLSWNPTIRVTSTGLRIVDVDGVAVSYQQQCIQESVEEDEAVRSLVFREDGHLYTSWSRKSSIIF